MINNKQGLSAIVVTLILVLLSLVAVGIVWVVIGNLVETQSGKISTGTQCLEIDVGANAVVAGAVDGDYTVTLKRSAGGEEISGVKMVLFSDTANTEVIKKAQALETLGTSTISLTAAETGTLADANKIEVTPYITDASGNEQGCTTSTFEF
ncbi:MAG: hypothetical protein AABX28_03775 [Nanoarchaeota archaeon]